MLEYDAVTLEDCIELYEKKDTTTVINDGKITSFEKFEKGEKNE